MDQTALRTTTAGQPGQATFHYIRPDSAKIEFQGLNQTEFLEFVHAIRFKAMQQGKQRDDEWLADYAATCFVGDALLWHLGLSEEVQHSWKLLLEALMEKYTGPEKAQVPIPAAASPQAASSGVVAAQVPRDFQITRKRGSVRVRGGSRGGSRGAAASSWDAAQSGWGASANGWIATTPGRDWGVRGASPDELPEDTVDWL